MNLSSIPVEEVLPEHLLPEAQRWRAARRPSVTAPVRWALGLAAWVSGSLFAGALFALDPPEAALLALGIALAALSCAASWVTLPDVLRPPVLVAAVLARVLVASQAEEVGALLLELAFVLAHRDRINQTFAVFAAWWLLGEVLGASKALAEPLAVVATAVAASMLALRRRWLATALHRTLGAVADGTAAFALVVPATALFGDGWSPLPALVFGLAAVAVSGVLARSAGLGPVAVAAAVIGPAVLAASTLAVPGVQVTLLLAVLAFATRHRWLWGASVAGMALYGAFFYYDLELPLWWKGGSLVASGLALLAIGHLSGRYR